MTTLLKNFLQKLRNYGKYRQSLRELNQLTDRELNDIGIGRGDIYRVAKEVDLTRQELARYDQTLEDCFSILQGYIGLLERNQEGDEHDESQPEDG